MDKVWLSSGIHHLSLIDKLYLFKIKVKKPSSDKVGKHR